MKCPFCSAENPDNAKFCSTCGKVITIERVPITPASPGGFDIETQSFMLLGFAIFMFMMAFMFGVIAAAAESGFWLVTIGLAVIGVAMLVTRFLLIRAYERKLERLEEEARKAHESGLVKIKCRYCGGLNDQDAQRCAFCSAPL